MPRIIGESEESAAAAAVTAVASYFPLFLRLKSVSCRLGSGWSAMPKLHEPVTATMQRAVRQVKQVGKMWQANLKPLAATARMKKSNLAVVVLQQRLRLHLRAALATLKPLATATQALRPQTLQQAVRVMMMRLKAALTLRLAHHDHDLQRVDGFKFAAPAGLIGPSG